jgi:hypothetical protein
MRYISILIFGHPLIWTDDFLHPVAHEGDGSMGSKAMARILLIVLSYILSWAMILLRGT